MSILAIPRRWWKREGEGERGREGGKERERKNLSFFLEVIIIYTFQVDNDLIFPLRVTEHKIKADKHNLKNYIQD